MADTRMVKLEALCDFKKGATGLAKATPGKYTMVTTSHERRSCDEYQFDTKAVCIPLVSSTGHGHASLKNVHYQEGKFALGTILVALTAKEQNVLDIQFLHLYLSQLKDSILVPLMRGAANVTLSIKSIKGVEIPLPSIERQREIVNKFENITVEEKAIKSELTHQQDLLKKLRQQILQESIEGKLTVEWRKQNPDVEPASKLIERIQSEKEQLIKNKIIGKQKPLSDITIEDIAFDVPEGWEWCRLGSIVKLLTKGSSPKWQGINYVDQDNGILFVTSKNVGVGEILFHNTSYVESRFNKISPRSILQRGDVLTNLVGASIARTAMFELDVVANINQAVALVRVSKDVMCREFLVSYMNSVIGVEYLLNKRFSPGRANVSLTDVRHMMVPIPPLDEQKAIVSKVEQLFALCDQLEEQITNNQTNSNQLMQAVLKEAFTA